MDDTISRKMALEVIEAMRNLAGRQGGKVLCGKLYSQIKDLPAIDAVPVVHGRPVWISPLNPDAKVCLWKCSSLCSICGDYVAGDWWYCPNCGAKLDGE